MLGWGAWARVVPVTRAADRVYLTEIARFADTRGVAKLSREDLAEVAGVSARSVSRHLTSLERDGLLRREQLREPGGEVGRLRVQLLRTTAAIDEIPQERSRSTRFSSSGRDQQPIADANDGELRAILNEVSEETPGANDRLAQALSIAGPRRFRSIIGRRNQGNTGDPQGDTISVAYEIAVTNPTLFAAARSPWALLATHTRTKCRQLDGAWWEDEKISTHGLPEGDRVHMSPIQQLTADEATFGIDEIDAIPELVLFVDALIEAGMKPALAYTGTHTALSYLKYSAHHRHQLIANDKTLHGLGVSPDASRAWLSAITGSRRGIGGLANSSETEINQAAEALVAAIQYERAA